MCHVSGVFLFFYIFIFLQSLELVGGGSVINGVYPVWLSHTFAKSEPCIIIRPSLKERPLQECLPLCLNPCLKLGLSGSQPCSRDGQSLHWTGDIIVLEIYR